MTPRATRPTSAKHRPQFMSTGAPQSAGPRVWVSPACTAAVLVGMHMLPGADLDADTWWATWHMDKVLHVIAFSGCALTWAIALAKQRRFQGGWTLDQLLVGGGLVFGMVLEAMQGAWMSGRTFDWMDVVADVVGAGSSLGVFFVIFGQRPGRIASD